MSQLPGTEVLRDGPDSMANVVAGQFQSRTVLTNAPQGDMNMGMLSIEMRHGHPFQLCSEVPLHPRHQISGQLVKVEPFAKLRRYDQLPQSRVSLALPPLQLLRRVDRRIAAFPDAVRARVEDRPAGALSRYVASVSQPLSGCLIRRVHRPDCTALVELFARPCSGTVICSIPRPA